MYRQKKDWQKRAGNDHATVPSALHGVRDLDLLTIGVVLDMWTEKANDGVKYRRIADQSDFDKF